MATMSNESATTAGWIVFASAIAMMCGMLAIDVAALKEWSQLQTPLFVGTTLGHVAAVIGSFVGGKLIPSPRGEERTRAGDPKDGQ